MHTEMEVILPYKIVTVRWLHVKIFLKVENSQEAIIQDK